MMGKYDDLPQTYKALINACIKTYGIEILVEACEDALEYKWRDMSEKPDLDEKVIIQGRKGGLYLCKWDGVEFVSDRNTAMRAAYWLRIKPNEEAFK